MERIGVTVLKSEVFNIDCMEALRSAPDNHWDLAIVDPPYGKGIANRAALGSDKNGHAYAVQKNGTKLLVKCKQHKVKEWDNSRPSIEYFKELIRVSKNQIIWGGNYFADLLPVSAGWLFWDKEQSANYGDGELAWTSFDRSIEKITVRWNGMIQYDMSNREVKIHPTHKPILLYKKTIDIFCQPGNKILDTHLGSGSSRIAAYDMGYDFTGFEIDKDYFEAQEKRFQQYKSQLKLFQSNSP